MDLSDIEYPDLDDGFDYFFYRGEINKYGYDLASNLFESLGDKRTKCYFVIATFGGAPDSALQGP